MKKDMIVPIIVAFAMILFFVAIGCMIFDGIGEIILEDGCLKSEVRWFRVEGTGGLFGGTINVKTTEENGDFQKKVCVEGYNLWGEKIKLK
ncbi:hypothetical protein KY314_05155 [Candidatus Woesearchaeota archaeon]|nr:hypothetical protein [Candidatus Woesearchaeota archaeon]